MPLARPRLMGLHAVSGTAVSVKARCDERAAQATPGSSASTRSSPVLLASASGIASSGKFGGEMRSGLKVERIFCAVFIRHDPYLLIVHSSIDYMIPSCPQSAFKTASLVRDRAHHHRSLGLSRPETMS